MVFNCLIATQPLRGDSSLFNSGSQGFLVTIWSTSEGCKTELTLEPPSGFEPGTPGLEIQHLNHQAIARLDLPIFFLYMSKHCSISVMYSYSNRFIFCTTKCHSCFRTIEQNKILSFDTFSIKKI